MQYPSRNSTLRHQQRCGPTLPSPLKALAGLHMLNASLCASLKLLSGDVNRFSVTTVITGIMLNVSARRNVNTPLLYLTPRRIGFAQYAFAPSPHTCLIWMMILIEVVLILRNK